MPRYYFNVYDGLNLLDEVGTVLPSMKEVRDQSIRYAGELLQAGGRSDLWSGHEWRMVVSDSAGAEVLTLRFAADDKTAET